MRPVRSKALDILADSFAQFEVDRLKNTSRETRRRAKNTCPEVSISCSSRKSKSKQDFEYKLSEGLYNSFNKKDWLMYWQYKAKQFGINYIILKGNYPKEYAILGSLLKNFSVDEIKVMIDFLWDCDHDVHPKHTMGTWILSKGWINTVYQSAMLWRGGKYKTEKMRKEQSKRNREWVGSSTETSTNNGEKKHKNRIRI